MRGEALSRLLDGISLSAEITVVTRWRLADLLSGASDLAVYDLVESRKIPLYLRQDLHAKFYAADDMCLIGSANVTLTALGWRTPANFELLTPIPRAADRIVEFERAVLSGAVRATGEQRDRLRELLDGLKGRPEVMSEIGSEARLGLLPQRWVPRTRNPEELYSVYSGKRDVSRAVLETMQEELSQIGVVAGVSEEEFRAWVAATINQTPLVAQVIEGINTEGEVNERVVGEILAEIGVDERTSRPRDVLEILERWFTHFFPEKFVTVQDSIRLIRAREL